MHWFTFIWNLAHERLVSLGPCIATAERHNEDDEINYAT